MNPLITGRNLSKSYGSKLALNNVNFEIEQGAPVALVGPNGAGKTTLFSLLNPAVPPYLIRSVLYHKMRSSIRVLI